MAHQERAEELCITTYPEQYPQDAREGHPGTNGAMAVGDLDSDARGTGARKNAGKLQLDLIPVSVWRALWANQLRQDPSLSGMLTALDAWQRGSTGMLKDWLGHSALPSDTTAAVQVLEFGAKKYKAWNWAKGMPWSVCVGCILRHSHKILMAEANDPESGIAHWGHIVCNIIFLVYYADNFPEGDDRPPQYAAEC